MDFADNLFGGDGYTAHELLFRNDLCQAYTYDDVILLPGRLARKKQPASGVVLSSRVSRNIELKVPLVSSPMDTVTEHRMAIGMALQGALGVIHYNMSVEDQVAEVKKVKKFKNGFITEPYCVSEDMTLAEILALKEKLGFCGFPVTKSGRLGGQLVGIITNRDIDFIEDKSRKVREVMTTELVTAIEGVSLAEANKTLQRSKKGKLPVVNSSGDSTYPNPNHNPDTNNNHNHNTGFCRRDRCPY